MASLRWVWLSGRQRFESTCFLKWRCSEHRRHFISSSVVREGDHFEGMFETSLSRCAGRGKILRVFAPKATDTSFHKVAGGFPRQAQAVTFAEPSQCGPYSAGEFLRVDQSTLIVPTIRLDCPIVLTTAKCWRVFSFPLTLQFESLIFLTRVRRLSVPRSLP